MNEQKVNEREEITDTSQEADVRHSGGSDRPEEDGRKTDTDSEEKAAPQSDGLTGPSEDNNNITPEPEISSALSGLFDGGDVDIKQVPEEYADLAGEALRIKDLEQRRAFLKEESAKDAELMGMLAREEPELCLPVVHKASEWLLQEYPPPDQILKNTFDAGSKVAVIGNSKGRKSFWVLQLALSVGSGCGTFLQWTIPKPRKVLIVQLEIQEGHYHKRLRRMADSLGIDRSRLENVDIINARGVKDEVYNENGFTDGFIGYVTQERYKVVIIDPLYKILEGDENKAEDIKPTLANFDRICKETGAALVFVHHNPKGVAGDRQTIDRGAGSSVLARDFDTAFYISDHEEDDKLVVETIARCYAPQDPFSMRWDESGCCVTDDTPPKLQTSASNNRGREVTEQDVESVLGDGVLGKTELISDLQQYGTRRSAENIVKEMLDDERLDECREPGRNGRKLVGKPDPIEQKKKEFNNEQQQADD